MARKREEVKPTIVGRLYLESPVDKAKLLHLMRKFRDAIEMAHYHMRQGRDINEIHRRLTRFLDNGHYAHSAYQRARLYKNQPYLKLRKPQLFSVGRACEKGNRNIRLSSTERVKIKIPHADGRHEWIEGRTRFGSRYLPLIEELVKLENISYSAGIYIEDRGFVICISVPLELYVKHFSKKPRNKIVGHIASFDLNPDRICMVIVNQQGKILDIRNEYFPEVTSHGFPREKAMHLRREAISKLVTYASEHGVEHYVVERLSKPRGKAKSKSGRRKQSKFAVREYLQQMQVLVPKVGGKLHKLNPAYVSIDAIPLSKKLGLDIHTTSAYLLAIRYIRNRRTKRNKN